MSKTGIAPKIRFKGFTDDWEQRNLGEVLDFSLKTNSLSRSMLNYEDGEVKNIHYGDILMNYGSILNFKTDTIPYITEGKIEEFNTQLLKDGDVVLADAAEDESVGKAIEINGLEEQYLVAGLHTIVGRPEIKFAERFLGYYINSNSYHRQLLPMMQGTKVLSISKASLQKTSIIYPKVSSEQLKIGEFFKFLDNSITLHQRKYDQVVNFKKAMLEKMFPKNGSRIPEIRFKEFSSKWEKSKAKNLCNIGTGKSNTQDQVEDGIYPFYIRSENAVKSNKYLYDCEAVITIGDGNIGKVFHYINGKFDLHQRCYKMTDFQNIFGKYFYYYFSTCFYDRAMKMTAKATVDSVRLEMISEMDIWKPMQIEEQIKIAEYFEKIDRLIELHHHKLQQLKNIEKAMLEKMFV